MGRTGLVSPSCGKKQDQLCVHEVGLLQAIEESQYLQACPVPGILMLQLSTSENARAI